MATKYLMTGATVSDCTRYRYRLWRYWDIELPPMCFIMLNPSTADAEDDDATVRKCVGFAKANDCGSIEIVNLFAFRSRDPNRLLATRDKNMVVGPLNDNTIKTVAKSVQNKGGIVVCGWGAHLGARMFNRNDEVTQMLQELGVYPYALGFSKSGHPFHPLMLAYERELLPVPHIY